ncbi:MAG: exodeoxyribonuclease VII large subunit [Candidatus Chaera renei]|uniref:Exodeoxyribonuclease 7 large subunit n=1 Tax=Candidatus Chaera renei TaxID=2506947 RepID=A0A4Q0AJB0_9BACT|nr:MAG: exodeoxyribonuclease VII large subunit [Candidatus Chaera renei]
MESAPLSVSQAIALINSTLAAALPVLVVEGEVADFKISKGKYVFFDIKDTDGTIGCFMSLYAMRLPLADGMMVRLVAEPRLTAWGRFSLTVRAVRPMGEGSLKRSFDMLRAKLEREGLFEESRKRPLPVYPQTVGVITSTDAAGFRDFLKILNGRWGGMKLLVANVLVQGMEAPGQIIRAVEYFNGRARPPQALAIIRGGGSADDLAAFNDEPLVRAVAASRIPTLVGVGHETDVSLADLAADVRAATPSNAAQLLVPDRREVIADVNHQLDRLLLIWRQRATGVKAQTVSDSRQALNMLLRASAGYRRRAEQLCGLLRLADPDLSLKRGYALVRLSSGKLVRQGRLPVPGQELTIESYSYIIKAGVRQVYDR